MSLGPAAPLICILVCALGLVFQAYFFSSIEAAVALYNLAMRFLIAFPALIAVAAAQAESFTFATTRATTTEDDVQPTATESLSSGPVETAKACGQISDLVRQSNLDFPSVEAEVSRSPILIQVVYKPRWSGRERLN